MAKRLQIQGNRIRNVDNRCVAGESATCCCGGYSDILECEVSDVFDLELLHDIEVPYIDYPLVEISGTANDLCCGPSAAGKDCTDFNATWVLDQNHFVCYLLSAVFEGPCEASQLYDGTMRWSAMPVKNTFVSDDGSWRWLFVPLTSSSLIGIDDTRPTDHGWSARKKTSGVCDANDFAQPFNANTPIYLSDPLDVDVGAGSLGGDVVLIHGTHTLTLVHDFSGTVGSIGETYNGRTCTMPSTITLSCNAITAAEWALL